MSGGRGFVSETPIRVRYAETDAMAVVHHSAYVVWLEAGRSDWMRQLGSSYRALEAAGHFLPVTELSVRFLAPARYDDLITVRTWVAELKSRKIRFEYEVVDAAGRALARGQTVHLCTNREGQVAAIPAEVRELLGSAEVSGRPGGSGAGGR